MSGHHYPQPAHVLASNPRPSVPILKIFWAANPDYCLANLNGQVTVAPADKSDPNQQWKKDWSVKAKDKEGLPAFALLNRATDQALTHGRPKKESVTLGSYCPGPLNEAVLFTQSADVGRGYYRIRPMNDISLNLDVKVEDGKHHGGLQEGAEVLLFKRLKKESQIWKITPISESAVVPEFFSFIVVTLLLWFALKVMEKIIIDLQI